MIDYVDQSASGLIFYLTQGDVDVHALTVLASTEVSWDSYTVEAGILGASHYLRIRKECDVSLVEVFACAELNLKTPLIVSGPLGTLETKVNSRIGPLIYSFEPRRMTWEKGRNELTQLTKAVEDAKVSPCRFGLSFEFPCTVRDGKKAVTLVLGDFISSQFILRTAHCYPNENVIVFTRTTLEKERNGQ
jgi:hypothetical protein